MHVGDFEVSLLTIFLNSRSNRIALVLYQFAVLLCVILFRDSLKVAYTSLRVLSLTPHAETSVDLRRRLLIHVPCSQVFLIANGRRSLVAGVLLVEADLLELRYGHLSLVVKDVGL